MIQFMTFICDKNLLLRTLLRELNIIKIEYQIFNVIIVFSIWLCDMRNFFRLEKWAFSAFPTWSWFPIARWTVQCHSEDSCSNCCPCTSGPIEYIYIYIGNFPFQDCIHQRFCHNDLSNNSLEESGTILLAQTQIISFAVSYTKIIHDFVLPFTYIPMIIIFVICQWMRWMIFLGFGRMP